MYTYIQRDDLTLQSLSKKASNESDFSGWTEKATNTESNVISCLNDSVLEKTKHIVVDDKKLGKDLWEEIKRMFTTPSQPKITNVHTFLIIISFGEENSWDSHVSTFMSTINALATFNQALSEEKKVAKPIGALPTSLEPLAMRFIISNMTFDQLAISVHAEIEQRKIVMTKMDLYLVISLRMQILQVNCRAAKTLQMCYYEVSWSGKLPKQRLSWMDEAEVFVPI